MRTDVGTFVFRVYSQAVGVKVTVEYASGSDPIVFHLRHHPPNSEAAVQLSGHLLEIEAGDELIGKIWQAESDNQVAKRWERDKRCMNCDQNRERYSHVCRSCLMKAVVPPTAQDPEPQE